MISQPTRHGNSISHRTTSKHQRAVSFWQKLELPRKIYHSTVGLGSIYIYYKNFDYVLVKKLALVLASICFSIEFLRFRWKAFNRFMFAVMGALSRSSEYTQLTGCFWYFLGVLFSVFCLPKDLAFLTILYVAFCDPMASFVGRAIGQYTFRFSNRKTLAGALGSFATAYLITTLFYSYLARERFYCEKEVSLDAWSVISGIVVALSEIVNVKGLDDNFTIPVISGISLYAISKGISFFHNSFLA